MHCAKAIKGSTYEIGSAVYYYITQLACEMKELYSQMKELYNIVR